MVCLSVILLCYRITCLWICNKRVCNKKGTLYFLTCIYLLTWLIIKWFLMVYSYLLYFTYLMPLLVWLSELSTGLQTKGLPVWFPVRAHAWVVGQVPSRGHVESNHTLMFLSLSFSLPSPLSKNKLIKSLKNNIFYLF